MSAPFLLFSILPVLVVVIMAGWDKTILACCGMGAAIASYAIETAVDHALVARSVHLTDGLLAFLLFGFTEEATKYVALGMTATFNRVGRQVVQASIFCAIGFASVENFLYISGFWHALGDSEAFSVLSLLRFFMPFMMHLVNGPILVSGHCIKRFRPLGGLFLATLFHGTYDATLMTPSPYAFKTAYLLIVGGFVVSALIYRNANDGKEWNHEGDPRKD